MNGDEKIGQTLKENEVSWFIFENMLTILVI